MSARPLAAPRTERPARSARRAARAAALVAALALGATLTACAEPGAAVPASSAPSAAPSAPQPSAPSATPSAPQPSAPGSEATDDSPAPEPLPVGTPPARVAIPAIDLDEPLIPLGIAPEGDIEVPEDYDEVGWFEGGGRPGGRGPTVIAAHVDSGWGPAAFARLTELAPGDTVDVTDVEGALVTYVVTEVADHPRADFPTAKVFGALGRDALRLITCTGFDPDASAYLDNRVVYAERADAS